MENKKMDRLVNKNIKDGPGSRLQSFRLPRDLSLGGNKISKKVYKPNLNVIRHKEKREHSKFDRKNKGKQLDIPSPSTPKQRYVQSAGVFSDGFGNTKLPEKKVYLKEFEKPQLKSSIKDSFTLNKPIRQEVPNIEISYKNETYSDDEDDQKDVPFSPIKWNFHNLFKQKPEEATITPKITDFSEILQTKNCNEVDNRNVTMTLWQLPDSFNIKHTPDKKLVDCRLTDLPEGQIGKLCVRKSGRIEVLIGKVKYELTPAGSEIYEDGCMENIVSLKTENPDECTVNVLGNISSQYTLNPAWQYIL